MTWVAWYETDSYSSEEHRWEDLPAAGIQIVIHYTPTGRTIYDGGEKKITQILDEIQRGLFEKSKRLFDSKIKGAKNLDELKSIIEEKKVGIVSLCKEENCEENIKSETKGAKAVFIADTAIKNEKCIVCGKKADYFVYVGKTY